MFKSISFSWRLNSKCHMITLNHDDFITHLTKNRFLREHFERSGRHRQWSVGEKKQCNRFLLKFYTEICSCTPHYLSVEESCSGSSQWLSFGFEIPNITQCHQILLSLFHIWSILCPNRFLREHFERSGRHRQWSVGDKKQRNRFLVKFYTKICRCTPHYLSIEKSYSTGIHQTHQ